jgi:hypothetical protein
LLTREKAQSVFANLIQDVKQELGDGVRSFYFGVWAGLFVVVALFLLTVSAYVWMEVKFGAIRAGLGLAAFYLAMALFVSIVAALGKKRRRRREADRRREAQNALITQQQSPLDPNWLTNPATLAAGLDVMRKLTARGDVARLIVPAVVLGVALIVATRRAVPHS